MALHVRPKVSNNLLDVLMMIYLLVLFWWRYIFWSCFQWFGGLGISVIAISKIIIIIIIKLIRSKLNCLIVNNMTKVVDCFVIIMIIMIIMLVDRAEALEEVGLILSVYCCFPGEKGGRWVVAFLNTPFFEFLKVSSSSPSSSSAVAAASSSSDS